MRALLRMHVLYRCATSAAQIKLYLHEIVVLNQLSLKNAARKEYVHLGGHVGSLDTQKKIFEGIFFKDRFSLFDSDLKKERF